MTFRLGMTEGALVAHRDRRRRLDASVLVGLLSGIPSLAELVVHPGVGTDAIARDYAWGYRWDTETSALCSDVVREAMAARNIDLVSVPC